LLKHRRDAYILELNAVYAANLARRKVELVRARASFLDARGVSAGGRRLQAPHVIIATGGRARRPLIPGAELGITSDGFFELSERPRRVAVVAAVTSPSSSRAFSPASGPTPPWCCAGTRR